MAGVRVRVLGPLEAEVDGSPVDLGPPKQRAVLAHLAARPGVAVPLDRLIDDLWGDQAPPRATASLQAYVSNLRRALEPDRPRRAPARVLVSRPPGYALDLGAEELDAARFEALVADARTAAARGADAEALAAGDEALALWRGSPFADFPYEPFAEPARTRLEGLHLELQRLRSEVLLRGGHARDAAQLLVELTTRHPLDEALWALRMRSEYAAGRQADALASFQQARRVLAEELGLDPGPELRRLEQQVLDHDPTLDPTGSAPHGEPGAGLPVVGRPGPAHVAPPSTAAVPSGGPAPDRPDDHPTVVGRDDELSRLGQALERARAGRTAFALVTGEPGIGKTALVEHLLARSPAVVAAWGRSIDQAGSAGLWPWSQVVAALLGEDPTAAARARLGPRAAALAPLLPSPAAADGPEDGPAGSVADPATEQLRVFDAVRLLLEGRADPGEVVAVVLEDVHWADTDSLRLLDFLATELRHAPVLVVVTYREEELGPGGPLVAALAGVARHPDVTRVHLQGLDRAGVARCAALLTGAPLDDATAAAVLARTEGNPFFVTELVRLLVAEQRLDAPDEDELPIPAGVRDVVRRRVERLPETTRAVLAVAALAGPDVPLDVVQAACRLEDDPFDDALEPALLAGLVEEVPDRPGSLRFSHALVRDTVAEDLTSTRRRRLHTRIAAALEGATDLEPGVRLPALAHHFAEVAGPGQAAPARRYAVEAARWSEQHAALDDAVRAWEAAARFARLDPSAPPEESVDVLVALAVARARLGDARARDAVVEAADAALALGDTERATRAALTLMRHDSTWVWTEFRRSHPEVLARLEAVLDALGPGDSAARARVLAVLANGRYYLDRARSEEAMVEALAMARRLGDPTVLRDVLVARMVERGDDHVEVAEELLAIGRALDDTVALALAHMDLAFALLARGDVAASDTHRDEADRLMADHAMPVGRLQLDHYLALRATMEGRWDDAEAAVTTLVDLSRRTSLFGSIDVRPVLQLVDARREQGRAVEFEPLIRELADDATSGAQCMLAIALLQQGRTDEAREVVAAAGGIPLPWGDWRRSVEATMGAEVAVALGDLDTARALLPHLRAASGTLALAGNLDCTGPVDCYLGRVEVALGDRAEGLGHLRAGLALAERVGSPPWRARGHLWLACALDGDERRAHASAALALAEALGNEPVAREARDLLG